MNPDHDGFEKWDRHLTREMTPEEENELYRRFCGGTGPITVLRGPRPSSTTPPADQTDQQPEDKPLA